MSNIREIAQKAGVSPATVSLVLNGHEGVGKRTKEIVLEVVKANNYKLPKREKKALTFAFAKYKMHGMLVEQNDGFIMQVIEGIEAACKERKIDLKTFLPAEGQNFRSLINEISGEKFNAVLVLGTELNQSDMDFLMDASFPFIVIDNPMSTYHCACVSIDNKDIVYSALQHLKTLGHNRVGYFKSRVSIPNFNARSSAFSQYTKELGLVVDNSEIFSLSPTLFGAYEDMKQILLDKKLKARAYFADNDSIAIGAMKALLESGYNIPEDISVIGFDDIPFSAVCTPPLTTMSIPKWELGHYAVEQLADQILARGVVIKSFISAEFILRDSVKDLRKRSGGVK